MAVSTLEPTEHHTHPVMRNQISRVPYLPGLDGLRAIAVVGVMVYHADHLWLTGGFLGVEVFGQAWGLLSGSGGPPPANFGVSNAMVWRIGNR